MKAKEAQSKIKPSLAGAACRELSFGTKIARIGWVVRTKACDNEKTESFLHYRFIISYFYIVLKKFDFIKCP